jgi:hypothetical protein
MKKYLRDNPVGPLPNTRMRYLTDEQVKAYLQSALADGLRSGKGRVISARQLMTEIRKRLATKGRRRRPKGSRQVGLVDRANPRFAKHNAHSIGDDDDLLS